MQKHIKIIAFVISGIIFLNISSCKDDKKQTVKPVVISFEKEGELKLLKASSDSIIKTINIEIADDDYQTQTGLMYRDYMKDNEGMLFVFPDSRQRSFYMKNTRIPLDIIYINENKRIVSFQKNAKPFDETSLPSNASAKYVLELNAGLSEQWNLEIDDTINFTQF